MTPTRRPHRPTRPARTATAARLAAAAVCGVLGATAVSVPASADPEERWPRTFRLPDGFQPEGIAIGDRIALAYTGSLADGDIFRINLRTGKGRRISQGPGTPSVGMKLRRGRLFVAGGPAGDARIVSVNDGEIKARWRFGPANSTFVNDVVLTRRAAWFTDSLNPVLYRVPLTAAGRPTRPLRFTTVPLRGQWEQGDGFGANGISTAPNGKRLLVVNSTTGRLYRVNKLTGRAERVRLRGLSLTNGDGLLRDRRILYVVRNSLNRIVVLRLSPAGAKGRRLGRIESPRFDVPTTVAAYRDWLYLPNARFGTTPTPSTRYTVTRVRAAR